MEGGLPNIASMSHFLPTALTDANSVAAGDLDQDGDIDLVVAGRNADTVTILWNNGNTAFDYDTRTVLSTTALGAFSVKVADINGDGLNDIVVSLRDANLIRMWRNAGSVRAARHCFTDMILCI